MPFFPVGIAAVERWIEIPTACGASMRGRIDVTEPHQTTDWKTIGDSRWALTEHQIAVDPQCITYTRDLFVNTDIEETDFRLVYLPKDCSGGWEERVTITRAQSDARWAKIEETVAEQQRLSVLPTSEIQGNLAACGDYGGCPHKTICPTGNPLMSFFESAVPAVVDKQTQLITELVAAGEPQDIVEDMTLVQLVALKKSHEATPARLPGDQINPPDGTPQNVHGGVKLPPRALYLPNTNIKVSGAKKKDLVPWCVDNIGCPEVEAKRLKLPELREEVAKFLRNEICVLWAIKPVADIKPLVHADRPAVLMAPVVDAPSRVPTVYYDCCPEGDFVRIEDWACDVIKAVQTTPVGGTIYPYYAAVPYAAGPAKVGEALALAMDGGQLTLPDRLFIDSSLPLAVPCLHVVRERGASVVRSVR